MGKQKKQTFFSKVKKIILAFPRTAFDMLLYLQGLYIAKVQDPVKIIKEEALATILSTQTLVNSVTVEDEDVKQFYTYILKHAELPENEFIAYLQEKYFNEALNQVESVLLATKYILPFLSREEYLIAHTYLSGMHYGLFQSITRKMQSEVQRYSTKINKEKRAMHWNATSAEEVN